MLGLWRLLCTMTGWEDTASKGYDCQCSCEFCRLPQTPYTAYAAYRVGCACKEHPPGCLSFECEPEFRRPSEDIIANEGPSRRASRGTEDLGNGTQILEDEARPTGEPEAVLPEVPAVDKASPSEEAGSSGGLQSDGDRRDKPSVIAVCPCDCLQYPSEPGGVCDCSGSPTDDKNRCDLRTWSCFPGTYSSATGTLYTGRCVTSTRAYCSK